MIQVSVRRSTWSFILAGLLVANLLAPAGAQESAGQSAEANAGGTQPAPVTFTTQEDHQNMMQQLGITQLRPGPSGRPDAPNSANYDESIANPFPHLPSLLVTKDGTRVTTPEQWWNIRRPEIVEDFEREVIGRVPENVPGVTWVETGTRELTVGGVEMIEKQLEGRVDNSACPEIEVTINMTVAVPKSAERPVPVLMMFGGFGFGGPRGGRGGPGGRGAAAQAPAQAQGQNPAPAQASAPAQADAPAQAQANPPAAPGRGRGRGPGGFPQGPSRTETLAKAGWGYAMIAPNSIQADNGAGLTRGIIGLTNKGQPRRPDDWGSLRAWAWGASRGLDYLETNPAVDARRVGIEGVSRYGKAALVAMAFEPRFAMVLVGSSGEGGAKLHRRNFGEAVENLTGSGEYHWMAGNFLKYGAAESSFGSKNAGDLPVDAHQLIALCAPRLTFVSYGIPERGDALWLDQKGSFMACVAAGPAFRLLGARDLGTSDDYNNVQMPAVNEGLLDGHLAWRQHDGGHTDGPNIEHFVAWADRMLKADQQGQ